MSQHNTTPIYHVEILAVPVVWMEDELLHTDEHPFCSDDSCPCRDDLDLFYEYVAGPLKDGLLTDREAKRLFLMEHL